jgi:hypothetical protein
VAEPVVDRPAALDLVRASEGAIVGTVVCAAAIAATAGHIDSIAQLCLVILGTVGVYWLAHLHAETIGSTLTQRHHPLAALRHAFWQTLPIAAVSVIPLCVLLVTTLLGFEIVPAAKIALFGTIALLILYSYIAGSRAGLDAKGRWASAVAGGGIGLLVVMLKVGLH